MINTDSRRGSYADSGAGHLDPADPGGYAVGFDKTDISVLLAAHIDPECC